VPSDRVSAQAYGSFDKALVVTVLVLTAMVVAYLDARQAVRAAAEDLSPEERAMSGVEVDRSADEDHKEIPDENADVAALAEGRASPPKTHRDEPAVGPET
jgi:hypothetical protein